MIIVNGYGFFDGKESFPSRSNLDANRQCLESSVKCLERNAEYRTQNTECGKQGEGRREDIPFDTETRSVFNRHSGHHACGVMSRNPGLSSQDQGNGLGKRKARADPPSVLSSVASCHP